MTRKSPTKLYGNVKSKVAGNMKTINKTRTRKMVNDILQ